MRTGRGRVFRNAEITPDVLLASACLPTMFQAVEIDGEAYWDGGYSRQPDDHAAGARMRLAATPSWCRSTRSSARARRASARDILNRLNEVSFNAVLLKELRMIALLRQVADRRQRRGRAMGRHAHPPRRAATIMAELGYSSKLNAEWAFLTMLRDEGRRSARRLPAAHADDLGKRSTLDLDALLEGV